MSKISSNFDPKQITKYFKDQPAENLSDLQKKNEKYYDTYFPPTKNSLFSKNSDGTFVDPVEGPALYNQFINDTAFVSTSMKHATELGTNWELFKGGINAEDVVQQGLGDCYFLASIASLSSYPELIQEKFRTEYNTVGYYEIVLFIDGQWQVVIVDDYLPVSRSNTFVFAKPNGNELWACLLEKAWAKVNGGYTNIIGGTSKDPLLALTGFPTVQLIYNGENEDTIYNKLLKGTTQESIMCCGTDGNGESNMGYGMVAGHEYSLLQAKQSKDLTISLIKLRNPWGGNTTGSSKNETEWTGDWSDSSKKWTTELKSYFGYEKKSDGVFFMAKNDFFNYYNLCEICQVLYGAINVNIHINTETLLKLPIVFNLKLTQNKAFNIAALFKNKRFNRTLTEQQHPCQIFVAKYDTGNNISDCHSEGNYFEDVVIGEDFTAGNYLIWVYVNYDVAKKYDSKFTYSLCIRSEDKNMELQYVGQDKTFTLLEKLMIARHNYKSRVWESLNGISVDMGSEHDKQLSYVIVKNKEKQVLKFTFDMSSSNGLKILCPADGSKSSKILQLASGETKCIIGVAESTSRSLGYGLSCSSVRSTTSTSSNTELNSFFNQNIKTNLEGNLTFELYTNDKEAESKYKEQASEILVSNKDEVIQSQTESEKKRLEELAKEEAEKKAKEEAAKKAQEEAERKAKEELERLAKEEEERLAQEEAERKAQEEAELKAKQEAERKAQEEAAKRAQEEAELKAKQEAEKKAQEEAAKKAIEEAAKKAQEEAEKAAKTKAEQEALIAKAKEEEQKKAEEEKKALEEKIAKEEAEKKAKEEAAKKAQEEALKKIEEQNAKNKRKRQERSDKAKKDRRIREQKVQENCRVQTKSLEELKKLNKYVSLESEFNKSEKNKWVYINDNTIKYYGQIDAKEMESGFGVLEISDIGRTIVGEFNAGALNGKGKLFDTKQNNLISFNYYTNGIKEGYGYQIETTGGEYKGFFSGNNKNGLGKIIMTKVKDQTGKIVYDEVQEFGTFVNNEISGKAIILYKQEGNYVAKACQFASNMKMEGYTLSSEYVDKTQKLFAYLDNEITKNGKEYKEMTDYLTTTYNGCVKSNAEKDSTKQTQEKNDKKKKKEEDKQKQKDAKKDVVSGNTKVVMDAYDEIGPANANSNVVQQFSSSENNSGSASAGCGCLIF